MKSIPAGRFAIYGLRCACHPENPIRYVGQTRRGTGRRLAEHLGGYKPHLPVGKWSAKHGESNVELVILEECASLEEMNPAEEYWITTIRDRGGADLNLTSGGDSPQIRIFTPEHRANLSAASRGIPRSVGESNPARKLGRQDVRRIWELHRSSELDVPIEAERLGVSKCAIWNILNGKSWWSATGLEKRRGDGARSVKRESGWKMSDEDAIAAHSEFSSGVEISELAERYGVSISTMGKNIKGTLKPKLGLPDAMAARHSGRVLVDADMVARVREIYLNGATLEAASRKAGVGATMAYSIIRGEHQKAKDLPNISRGRRGRVAVGK